MKEWTRKRKADVCMGILLQIYFFFPWIRIDGGYHTIHVYLIEIFRKESCIKAYNYIFLSGHPILWKYSGFAAVTFYHDHSIYDCDADDRTMAIVQTYERDQNV